MGQRIRSSWFQPSGWSTSHGERIFLHSLGNSGMPDEGRSGREEVAVGALDLHQGETRCKLAQNSGGAS